jgi:hypothetical protein
MAPVPRPHPLSLMPAGVGKARARIKNPTVD